MINADFIIRSIAVVAAIALVAGPYLVAAAKTAARWRPDDAHTILEIARRLQKAGLTDGVKLCQQLLDVLLKPEKQK